MWKIIETPPASAQANMNLDAQLLDTLGSFPILHFYEWERKSATYGCLVKPEEFLEMEEVKKQGLDLGKRPTGGGILFHLWDFAFSILIPKDHFLFEANTLASYRLINRMVMEAVANYKEGLKLTMTPEDHFSLDRSALRFCMAGPTKFDVIQENGKKVIGAAQRRTKKGILHQGTVSLQTPNFDFLRAVLLPGTEVLKGMQDHTAALILEEENLEQERLCFKEILAETLMRKR